MVSTGPQYVPLPGTAPLAADMPTNDAGERPIGAAVKVPIEAEAFINDHTLVNLLDPRHLNSAQLQDIYQQRDDDFEPPHELEVWYMVNGRPQKEFLFIDPLHSHERPRICVSIKAVQAMHRAIAVLTRKNDNVLLTLRTCRQDYYRELVLLRELVHRQRNAKIHADGTKEDVDHMAAFFDANKYQDEVSIQLFQERIQQATAELENRLQMKNTEIKRLHEKYRSRVTLDGDAIGLEAFDRIEQQDMEEQVQDLQAQLDVTKVERDQKDTELQEVKENLRQANAKITELSDQLTNAREAVKKKSDKHHQQMERIQEAKATLEKEISDLTKNHEEELERVRFQWAQEMKAMEEAADGLENQLAAAKYLTTEMKKRWVYRKGVGRFSQTSIPTTVNVPDESPYASSASKGGDEASEDQSKYQPLINPCPAQLTSTGAPQLRWESTGPEEDDVTEADFAEIQDLWDKVYNNPDEDYATPSPIKSSKSSVATSVQPDAEQDEEKDKVDQCFEETCVRIMADIDSLSELGPQACLEATMALVSAMGSEEVQELQAYLAENYDSSDVPDAAHGSSTNMQLQKNDPGPVAEDLMSDNTQKHVPKPRKEVSTDLARQPSTAQSGTKSLRHENSTDLARQPSTARSGTKSLRHDSSTDLARQPSTAQSGTKSLRHEVSTDLARQPSMAQSGTKSLRHEVSTDPARQPSTAQSGTKSLRHEVSTDLARQPSTAQSGTKSLRHEVSTDLARQPSTAQSGSKSLRHDSSTDLARQPSTAQSGTKSLRHEVSADLATPPSTAQSGTKSLRHEVSTDLARQPSTAQSGTKSLRHDSSIDFATPPSTAQSGTTVAPPSEFSGRFGLDSAGRDSLASAALNSGFSGRLDSAGRDTLTSTGFSGRFGLESDGRDALTSAGGFSGRLDSAGRDTLTSTGFSGRFGLESAGRDTLTSAGSVENLKGDSPTTERRIDQPLYVLHEHRLGRPRNLQRSTSLDTLQYQDEKVANTAKARRGRRQSLPPDAFQGEVLLAHLSAEYSSRSLYGHSRQPSSQYSHRSQHMVSSMGSVNSRGTSRGRGNRRKRNGRSKDRLHRRMCPKRRHSMGPTWSMPLHRDIGKSKRHTGLGRLTMSLDDLPTRHNHVAIELLSAGWVLCDPSGCCYNEQASDQESSSKLERDNSHWSSRWSRFLERKRSKRVIYDGDIEDSSSDDDSDINLDDAEAEEEKQTRRPSRILLNEDEEQKEEEEEEEEQEEKPILSGDSETQHPRSIMIGSGLSSIWERHSLTVLGRHPEGGRRSWHTARENLKAKQAKRLLRKAERLKGLNSSASSIPAKQKVEAMQNDDLQVHGSPETREKHQSASGERRHLVGAEIPEHIKRQSDIGVVELSFEGDAAPAQQPARRGSNHPAKRGSTNPSIPKARMVSIATQTSITVANGSHFEILSDKGEVTNWRHTSSTLDKDVLRARIAKELLQLAQELRKIEGFDLPGESRRTTSERHAPEVSRQLSLQGASWKKSQASMQLARRASVMLEADQWQLYQEATAMTNSPHTHGMPAKKRHLVNPGRLYTPVAEEGNGPLVFDNLQLQGQTMAELDDAYDVCPCGAVFVDDCLFCKRCGARRSIRGMQDTHCPCGTFLRAGTSVCPRCGRGVYDGMTSGHAHVASRSTLSDVSDFVVDVHKGSHATLSTSASLTSWVPATENDSVNNANSHRDMPALGSSMIAGLGVSQPSPLAADMGNVHGDAPVLRSSRGSTGEFPAIHTRGSTDGHHDGSSNTSAEGAAFLALSARSLVSSGKKRSTIVPAGPPAMPGMPNLSNFTRYFGDMVGASRSAVDALPPVDDSVIDRSKQWLAKQEHSLHPRPPGRPQTQGQAKAPRRCSTAERPVASDNWFPASSTTGMSSLPLQSIFHKGDG